MSPQICFPLFDPSTEQGASTARLSELELRGKKFVSCSLGFHDERHVTFYAHQAGDNWLNVKQFARPSWELYAQRPFPLHPIWVGAAVTIEMVSEITFMPVVGLSGVIDCALANPNGRVMGYVVKLDNPITEFPLVALPSISSHPVCLKLKDAEKGNPEPQAFYLWLAKLMEYALRPIDDARIWVKVLRDWVGAEDGRLLHRLYQSAEQSGEDVGASINLIESTNDQAYQAMIRKELNL